MTFSLRLSKVRFPGRVVPQIEFLKGHFESHWNLLKKKSMKPFDLVSDSLELMGSVGCQSWF